MANILIVDDSIIMRRNLTSILKEAGHTIVGEAGNGQQAYLQYQRYKPDIVTMDITMPNVDGIDALKHIMENDPSARVVMISALDQKSKVYTALRNGAKHYIIKPLTAEKIITVIDEVLAVEPEKDIILEEEVASPFDIRSEDDKFYIDVHKNLSYQDIIVMMGAIQGFLYLENPNIIFEFDRYDIVGEEGLSKFEAILNKIRSVEGQFQIKAKKPEFTNRLVYKDSDLDKTFDAGEFILE